MDVNDSMARSWPRPRSSAGSTRSSRNGHRHASGRPRGRHRDLGLGDAAGHAVRGGLFNPMDGTMTSQAVTLPGQMVNFDGMITVPCRPGVSRSMAARPRKSSRSSSSACRARPISPRCWCAWSRTTRPSDARRGSRQKRAHPLTPRGSACSTPWPRSGASRIRSTAWRSALPESVTAVMPSTRSSATPGRTSRSCPATSSPRSSSPELLCAGGHRQERGNSLRGPGHLPGPGLARSGGLHDKRADARGVFIFRFEDEKLLDLKTPPARTADGTVPVVYQVDLRDPASFS